MNTPGIISLERTEWDQIGSLWPGQRSLLSPMGMSGTGKLTRAKRQQFINSGWLDPSGRVAGNLHQALETLASTRSLAELTFGRQGSPLTCAVYFTAEELPGGASAWGMIADEDDRLTLCNAETVCSQVSEYLHSIAEKSPAFADGSQADYFNAVLQPAEAWILGVMLDMQRQSAILAAAQNPSHPMEARRSVCQVTSIHNIMSKIGNPQNSERLSAVLADEPGWSVLFFLSEMMQPAALSQEQVEAALRNLVVGKLIARQDTGYTLEKGPTRFANQFLTPEEMAFLRTCQEHGEQLEEDQLTCLRSGKAFLYALVGQQAPDRIKLSAGTSKLLVQTAGRVFEKPVSLASVAMPRPASPPQVAKMPPSSPPAGTRKKKRTSPVLWVGLGLAAIMSCCCIAVGIGLIVASSMH
jgi:hypothetical protein